MPPLPLPPLRMPVLMLMLMLVLMTMLMMRLMLQMRHARTGLLAGAAHRLIWATVQRRMKTMQRRMNE